MRIGYGVYGEAQRQQVYVYEMPRNRLTLSR